MGSQRILLVDDQPLVLTAIARVLEERGYDVQTAVNGEDALHSAESRRPDLIITDVQMPVMDGWNLVRHLRSRSNFTLTPVIILTDHDTPESRMQGFRLGADDFVPKTAILEELEVRIDRALRRMEEIERVIHHFSPKKGKGSTREKDVPGSPTGSSTAPPAQEEISLGLDLPPLAVAMGKQPAAKSPLAPPPSEGVPPTMTGTLDQIGLASILTLLSSGLKSGSLSLIREDELDQGQILMREGDVVRIRVNGLPDLRHADAISEMMSWRKARFSFVMQKVTVPDEVKTPAEHLLMEASRLLDEGLT